MGYGMFRENVMRRRQEGFSLAEILVVIAIIVVAAAVVSFSYFGTASRERVAGGAEAITKMLSGARQAAITSGSYRWLRIDLREDTLQSFQRVYDSMTDEEILEPVTGVERISDHTDITDAWFSTEEPADVSVWLEIADSQLRVQIKINPRGAISDMEYESIRGSDDWTSLGWDSPVFHVYTLSRSAGDRVHGSQIVFPGNPNPYPYRNPDGTGGDVIGDTALISKLRILPSSSPEREKCYTVVIYGLTGRAQVYEYGYGYPWPSLLKY